MRCAVTADEKFLKYLPDVSVFVSTDTMFGVPSIIVVPTLIFSIAVGVMSAWFFGVLLLAISMATLIVAHKDDKDAMRLWIFNIRKNPTCWIGGFWLHSALIIIEDDF